MGKKLTRKFLKREDVKELLENIGGPDAERIIRRLPSTKYRSEFELADDVNMHVNSVRSILYNFYERKMVDYTKKRDPQKGLYIYSWKLFLPKVKQALVRLKKKQVEDLEHKLVEEGEQNHFKCTECGTTYTYEQALNDQFSCPYDDAHLKMVDRQKEVRKIKRKKRKLEREIKKLEEKD